MKKISTILNTVLLAILLAACGEKTQTIEWYMQHQDVLKEESEKCKLKTQAELAKNKHCTVIQRAKEKAFDEQQRNAPPINIKFK